MKIYAIIPARGGSKGVPDKNIRLLKGYPVIAYSIVACKLSKKIDRIIVSTDSEKIAQISKKYGAEVPFLRPAEFATDISPDLGFMKHAVDWFEINEKNIPDFFIHIRPTTP
ncbi:MAG TPA: acylneuraminate cytidylyltransferase family protein, partial [bacterium]|nr:acylneuraminate cytidylyltransferase family protein [bacterium]